MPQDFAANLQASIIHSELHTNAIDPAQRPHLSETRPRYDSTLKLKREHDGDALENQGVKRTHMH